MNVKKPEQPSCSNLTVRQWKCILEQFEFEWDMERGYYQGPDRAGNILKTQFNDIGTLEMLSLICPLEVTILERYLADCRDAYVEEMEKFKKALIERAVISNENQNV